MDRQFSTLYIDKPFASILNYQDLRLFQNKLSQVASCESIVFRHELPLRLVGDHKGKNFSCKINLIYHTIGRKPRFFISITSQIRSTIFLVLVC